jgi:phosphoserine phosphatase RsbU/P
MATSQNPVGQVSDPLHRALHGQLAHRRERLEEAATTVDDAQLIHLLRDVDAALAKLETGVYGVCESCGDAIESEKLLADPLARFCIDHLPPEQQRALERDLELAAKIQSKLLPRRDFRSDGWATAYHYQPAGLVSGDYCDLVQGPDNELFFALGDVSGKGIAASLLMSNLSAMFRTLVPLGISVQQLMEHANRVFSESTLPTQYATLICGHATPAGVVEICNAGHVPALLATGEGVLQIGANSLPIGLFAEQRFATSMFELAPREFVLLSTDGISEARRGDVEYGIERLSDVVMRSMAELPSEVVSRCVQSVGQFQNGSRAFDDQTLMVIQRTV